MPHQHKMPIDERFRLIRSYQPAYRAASRAERTALLTRLEEMTGLHRKSLIRKLAGPCERRLRNVQHGRTYGPDVDAVLRAICQTHGKMSAEKLLPSLVARAEELDQQGALVLTDKLRDITESCGLT